MELKGRSKRTSVHRSFSLPTELVEEAGRLVPGEIAKNMNQLITVALRELVEKHRKLRFEREMAEMAADPGIKKTGRAIAREFEGTEADGLR